MSKLSLRRRIFLTLAPLVALLMLTGGSGVWLIRQLGQRSDDILRENYDSVRAMTALNEAADRMARATTPEEHDLERRAITRQMAIEAANLTIIPDEPILFGDLESALAAYDADPSKRASSLAEVKDKATAILRLNHEQMERASWQARRTARESLIVFSIGIVVAGLAAFFAGWRLVGMILHPIEEMTAATESIGSGELHRTVPVHGEDELGRLATAFNTMSGQVREFRRSNLRQLMRARETAQAAIDSFSDPVLVLDPEGCVELANPAASTILQVQPRTDAGAIPWTPPDGLRPAIDAALGQQRATVSDRFDQALIIRVANEERYYLPEVRPIRNASGDTLGAAVVLDDVTRFRLLDQLKGSLIATASHELKTPLTSIRLAVHLLLEESVGPLNPKQTELMLDARENAERLLTMIEQLLSLARLQDRRDEYQFERCRVEDLFRSAVESASDRAADHHLSLIIEDASSLPAVRADADRMAHALDNLLTNAINHTPQGGSVTLSAKTLKGNRVELVVTDTGRGIPPEAMAHLFERFYRVPGDDQPTGTGLGLAIVREIMEAHGGTALCESKVDQGASFRLTLPVWEETRR